MLGALVELVESSLTLIIRYETTAISGGSRIFQTRTSIPKVESKTYYFGIFSRKVYEIETEIETLLDPDWLWNDH